MKNTIRIIGPVVLLALWQAVAMSGVVDAFLLPGPYDTIMRLAQLTADGAIISDLAASMHRLATAMALAIAAGVPLGLALGYARNVYRSVEFIIDFFRSMPATAVFPLFMLLFGIGDTAKIAVTAFAAFLIILFNTAYGVMQASQARILAARMMGASRWQIFRWILLWETLPQTFVGVRIAIGYALAVVIVTEMFLGTNFGLGQRIINSQTIYDIPAMYATILVTGVVGYAINAALAFAQAKMLHWNR